jgi:hypothetical protein
MCYALGSGKAQKLQVAAVLSNDASTHRPEADERGQGPPEDNGPVRL